MALIAAFVDTHRVGRQLPEWNLKIHEKSVLLDFFDPFGRMSYFYGFKLPTIESSLFEEFEQTWAICEPTLELAVILRDSRDLKGLIFYSSGACCP